MGMGEAVCEAVGEFVKLVVHADKERVKLGLADLFRAVAGERSVNARGRSGSGEVCDDSDS